MKILSRKEVAKALNIPLSAVKEGARHSMTIEMIFISCLVKEPTDRQELPNIGGGIQHISEIRFNSYNRTEARLKECFIEHLNTTLNHLDSTLAGSGITFSFTPYIRTSKTNMVPLAVPGREFLTHKLYYEHSKKKKT